ncbi:uncharacterized protein LOC117571614 [Drosophila albomicans]|uniref:Uncharacterized protein LOC117571614 n=1 Tax=Drosophila albomicans TaxID=7291 RepID=A0A6P8XE35_DROAB|nr:uncharacterized protein LOC117571614 [Drosophila albomicans]
MCKILWFSVCFLTLLPLALTAVGSKVNVTDAQQTLQTPLIANHNSSSSLLPKAEQLIRYRRQPPKRNKQRRRVKGKYGPPSYPRGPSHSHGPPGHPPVSYYKPASSSYPSHLEEPSFSIEDFQHLKFDGADFHIPASSYEAQSMDLNLYSHEQEDNDLYGAHKFPSLEYSFPGDESPALGSDEHTPHQKYGVPPQQSHSHYSSIPSYSGGSGPSYSSGPSHSHSSSSGYSSGPSHSSGYSSGSSHSSNSGYSSGHSPSSSYSSGSSHSPSSSYSSGHSSSSSSGYSSGPSHSSGSSYSSGHSSSSSYSPSHNSDPIPSLSYETNSYETPDTYIPQQYGPPAAAAPPAPPSTRYGVPSAPAHVPSYSQPGPPPPPDSYSIYEQKIPNTGYHQNFAEPPRPSPNYEIAYSPPAYEISTSYQPKQPSYQPPPASSAHDGHFAEPPPAAPSPYTPPQQHHHQQQQPAEPPSSYGPPDAQVPTSYTNVELHPTAQQYPSENYALPSEELPLNPHHKFPSFDFPKSSYEVPIYDPIPFEASNKEEQESYPPILQDPGSNALPPSDAHASGTTQKSRKRKRRPSSAVISKKHTLDVPELQEAYDADSHVQVRGTDLDTAAYGSRYVEQKQRHYAAATSTTTTPAPWSPMRMRSTSSGSFIPTIITSTPPTPTQSSSSSSRSRSRGTSRYHQRTASTVEGNSETPSTAVTIQKSRSKSYYDGTIAPPTYRQFGRGTRPTRPVQSRGVGATLALQPGTERNPTLKRTTKGVFDTTLFKSPQTDREMERKLSALRQNLPKNHKLY